MADNTKTPQNPQRTPDRQGMGNPGRPMPAKDAPGKDKDQDPDRDRTGKIGDPSKVGDPNKMPKVDPKIDDDDDDLDIAQTQRQDRKTPDRE